MEFYLEYMVITYISLDFLQYLKEQRLPPQTFIPLQSVRIKPISEKLRTLGGTAKLIFDVIEYPLVLYIDWLLTPEHAIIWNPLFLYDY